MDDDGSSEVSRQLEMQLRVLSSATRNTVRTPASAHTRRIESPGKNVVNESDTDDRNQDDEYDDSDDDDEDTDY